MSEMVAHFTWVHVIWMGVGAGFGAAMRYCISIVMVRWSHRFPWPTLAVNLSGAFILGGGAAYFNEFGYSAGFFFWELGVLSGYTTMSAFALEGFYLIRDKRYVAAFTYSLLSLFGAVIALIAGFRFGGLLL